MVLALDFVMFLFDEVIQICGWNSRQCKNITITISHGPHKPKTVDWIDSEK
jgi:hypothetical protein